jgi:ABC-type sulfate transport system permease component
MVHSAQDTVRSTRNTVVDTIVENPIPAALAGIGLAWLFMSARSNSRASRLDA